LIAIAPEKPNNSEAFQVFFNGFYSCIIAKSATTQVHRVYQLAA